MSQQYTANKLYQHAYQLKYKWRKWLDDDVFKYHDLIYKEINAPVELQMGVLLPFIASVCGPQTRGLFLTRPSVLNLFWINIAASGVGKSQSRKRMVSEPLEYILAHSNEEVIDFEVSKYTRAGIEDKIIASKGYCCVITDEGTGFFDDLRKKESKHESDLSLLNQLYDGQGDKTTLAQNRERAVPRNSTSMSVSIQQEAFITGLGNMGRTLWLDNGFGERFIVTAVQPHKHTYRQNQHALLEMKNRYPEDLIGKIALAILEHHKASNILYTLDAEAKDLYEKIFDKYNSQFNMKYSVPDSDVDDSQPVLDDDEKSEISVRTKAPEIIGRLTCILWIYCNAFECVWKGKAFNIPKEITKDYVRRAEEVVNMSYNHSETFSSAIFSRQQSVITAIAKPKVSDRAKVVNALLKSSGPLLTVRSLAKNIRNMSTELVRDELQKLHDEGYGCLVSKEQMREDKLVASTQCCAVFCKHDVAFLKKDFFGMASDRDACDLVYERNYNKKMDQTLLDIALKYHPHKVSIRDTQLQDKMRIKKPMPRTALDDILDEVEREEKNASEESSVADTSQGIAQNGNKSTEKAESSNVEDKSNGWESDGLFASVSSSEDVQIPCGQPRKSDVHKKKVNKKYTKSKTGKILPVRFKDDCNVSESDLDSQSTKNLKSKKAEVSMVIPASTDTDSDFDVSTRATQSHISQKLPNKTVRWNRPKVDRQKTKAKEIPPLRRSERIQEIKDSKDESSSTDVVQGTADSRSRKRRLSLSKRNELHKKKKSK